MLKSQLNYNIISLILLPDTFTPKGESACSRTTVTYHGDPEAGSRLRALHTEEGRARLSHRFVPMI